MAETHKLAPAADRAVATTDNNPPDDPFIAGLEEALEDLLGQQALLELKAAKLPKEVTSDEDVATITAHVVARRALARKFEAARVERNKPLLEMQKKLNAWVGNITTALKSRADSIEARSGPYLLAKQAREKAEAEARAAEAKRIADEKAAEARRLQEEAEERAAAAQAERDRLAQEEADRVARETAAQRQAEADEDPNPVDLADNDAEADAAEESYRTTELERSHASMAATQAAADAATAAAEADKAAARALGGHKLGKVHGGAGNATVAMVWRHRVDNLDALLKSMGPLGPLLAQAAVEAALARAAGGSRPALPGVSYFEEIAVSTTAKRGN